MHLQYAARYTSVKVIKMDAAKSLQKAVGGKGFLGESFDRIILDAPCTGLGQRCVWR